MTDAKEEIMANLAAFMSKVAVIPPEEITTSDSLDALGIDSAAIISLSVHLEEEFGVVADAEDLPRSSTLEQIAEFVLRKRTG